MKRILLNEERKSSQTDHMEPRKKPKKNNDHSEDMIPCDLCSQSVLFSSWKLHMMMHTATVNAIPFEKSNRDRDNPFSPYEVDCINHSQSAKEEENSIAPKKINLGPSSKPNSFSGSPFQEVTEHKKKSHSISDSLKNASLIKLFERKRGKVVSSASVSSTASTEFVLCESCGLLVPFDEKYQTHVYECEQKPQEPTCPNDHVLSPQSTPSDMGCQCDKCKRPILSGSLIFSCIPCNYDLCDFCADPNIPISAKAWIKDVSNRPVTALRKTKNKNKNRKADPIAAVLIPCSLCQKKVDLRKYSTHFRECSKQNKPPYRSKFHRG